MLLILYKVIESTRLHLLDMLSQLHTHSWFSVTEASGVEYILDKF